MERKTGWQAYLLFIALILFLSAGVDLWLTNRYQTYQDLLPELRRINLIRSAVMIAICSLVFYIFRRRILKPMRQLVASIREIVDELVERLRPASRELDCESYLEYAGEMANTPSWSEKQLQILLESNDRSEIVRRLTERSRLAERSST